MKKKTTYMLGVDWGYKKFLQNYKNEGELGVLKSYKARTTCYNYAHNKVTRTKTGKKLDYDKYLFYLGAYQGFDYGFKKFDKGKK